MQQPFYDKRREDKINMAEIRAFQCVHPAEGYAAQIAALPYDVYSRKEARKQVEKAPLSFLRIDRAETQFDENMDIYAPEVYQKAHDLLCQMIEDHYFEEEQQECYYLYELTMGEHTQTGLVACASVDDYLNHVIKKHENTTEEKEQDRIRHVEACSAQTGPIFLAYRRQEAMQQITREVKEQPAMFDFVSDDGIRHRGWKIDEKETINKIAEIFAGLQEIYIADGHHRAASAVKAGLRRRALKPDYDGTEEFNYFLSVLFPDDELLIMDYNRVVKDLKGQQPEEFLRKVQNVFTMEKKDLAYRPEKKGTFGMYIGGQWYKLTAKPERAVSDPVEGLDVSYLHRELLKPCLNILNPKTCSRIEYVGGIRGLEELEKRVDAGAAVAFSLYPTNIGELFAVADAGELMPPKSTWFEPKLRSGLFIHKI